MLGLGSSIVSKPVMGKSIVRDGLVLQHNYSGGPVQPISSGAASFNGTSDYIAINAKPVDTADATYCWWSNSTQTQHQTIFAHGGIGNGHFYSNSFTSNKPLLYLKSDLYQYWVDTGFADDGVWHHWALVVDIDSMTGSKLYIDGVVIAQDNRDTTGEGAATSYGNMEIGRYNSSDEFDGYMCNFGVWSSHLSQAQIKSIMQKDYAGLSDSEKTDLVSWWNLDSTIPNYATLAYDNHHGGGGVLGSEYMTNTNFTTSDDWGGSMSINTVTQQLTKTSGGLAYQTSGGIIAGAPYEIVVDVESLDGNTTVWVAGNSYTLALGVQTIYAVGGTNSWNGGRIAINGGYSSGVGSVINSVSVKPINGNTGTLS